MVNVIQDSRWEGGSEWSVPQKPRLKLSSSSTLTWRPHPSSWSGHRRPWSFNLRPTTKIRSGTGVVSAALGEVMAALGVDISCHDVSLYTWEVKVFIEVRSSGQLGCGRVLAPLAGCSLSAPIRWMCIGGRTCVWGGGLEAKMQFVQKHVLLGAETKEGLNRAVEMHTRARCWTPSEPCSSLDWNRSGLWCHQTQSDKFFGRGQRVMGT